MWWASSQLSPRIFVAPLMGYNAGPKRIQQYRGRVKDIPDKFKEYPRRVNREHARFVRLMRGSSDIPDSEVLLARVQR